MRSVTGLHDRGFDPIVSARSSGFHGQVARLKWELGRGPLVLDVHQRVQVSVSSGEAPALGIGVSRVPARTIDLATDFVRRSGLRAWHDVDRLSLRFFSDVVDLTLGRQPITWGVSAIFPVADLWAQFSPFELDTEEKPGIDAVRALFYPAEGLELDLVVADRGSREDLSAGLRGTLGLAGADVWAGAGKFWRELITMGGVTVLLDQSRLRAEAALPWDLDQDTFQRPRATLGFDRIAARFSLTGEYHYNGVGARDAQRYLAQLGDPRLLRGESYYLGRHYLGVAGAWLPDAEQRLTIALSALANVLDPSFVLSPIVSYDVASSTTVSVGALASFGDRPVIAPPPPRLPTEFGAYGTLGFTRVSVYF